MKGNFYLAKKISKKKVAIFFSGKGSNMGALIDDMDDTCHPGTPELIISNNKNAEGLTFCNNRGLDAFIFPTRNESEKEQFELEVFDKRMHTK